MGKTTEEQEEERAEVQRTKGTAKLQFYQWNLSHSLASNKKAQTVLSALVSRLAKEQFLEKGRGLDKHSRKHIKLILCISGV